jgi:hypothetical protein
MTETVKGHEWDPGMLSGSCCTCGNWCCSGIHGREITVNESTLCAQEHAQHLASLTPAQHREPIPCEYGHPNICGKPATYMCMAKGYPHEMPGCDAHAPLMHGYTTSPPRCSSYYRLTPQTHEPPADSFEMAKQRVEIVERMMKLPYIKATRNASVGDERFVCRDDVITLIHNYAKELREAR